MLFRSVELPVRDGALVSANLLRDLALEQPQVEPSFAQVISNRCKHLRVCAGQGFLTA
jgi:hypothetical protein